MKLCFVLFYICCAGRAMAIAVTDSYLQYVYKKYNAEVSGAITTISKDAPKTATSQTRISTSAAQFGELIYMQIRDSSAVRAVDILVDCDISWTWWTLLALEANSNKAKNISTSVHFVSDKNDALNTQVKAFAHTHAPSVKLIFFELSSFIDMHKPPAVHDIFPDSVDVISLNLLHHRQSLIHNLLEPLIKSRPLELAGLQLFFLPAGSGRELMGKSSSSSSNSNGKSGGHMRSRNLTNGSGGGGGTKHSGSGNAAGSPLLEWLKESTKMSVDITLFEGSTGSASTSNNSGGSSSNSINGVRSSGAISSLAKLHKHRNAQLKNLPPSNPSANADSCGFVMASIVREPRVTIIIPAGRAHLLPNLLRTIKFNLVQQLIVVHSHQSGVTAPVLAEMNNPKITELFNTKDAGLYGNPERNLALASIPRNRTGWVYFLDDDNLMHQRAWMVIQTRAVSNIVLLGAEHCPDYNRDRFHMPKECKVGKVDTGNALFSTQKVITRTWMNDRIYDGPFIVDTCKMDKRQTVFLQMIASYHNGLLCDNVDFEY